MKLLSSLHVDLHKPYAHLVTVGRKPTKPGLSFVKVLRLFGKDKFAVRMSSCARNSFQTVDAHRVGVETRFRSRNCEQGISGHSGRAPSSHRPEFDWRESKVRVLLLSSRVCDKEERGAEQNRESHDVSSMMRAVFRTSCGLTSPTC